MGDNDMNPLALFSGPYAMLARAGVIVVVAVSLFGYGWVKGNQHGTEKLTEYIGKQATMAVAVAVKQGAVTVKVVNKYIKVAGATQVITETVEKEVIKYADANPGLCLDARWRLLHDAAATNTVPSSGPVADATSGAPQAATALETVTENYAKHNQCADRLDALQEWVREQKALK